ncbi:hypothetical protein LCGC14_0461720 [marine sediment metagenome]|uniref:DNA-directed DNA polymerase n=1 Tax=marine sediment metagenome TaxID=412755 RepID=A0A0F9SK30_9ZZZZ
MSDDLFCSACSLCRGDDGEIRPFVQGVGPVGARVVVVGDKPDDRDQLNLTCFSGTTGQILGMASEQSGFDIENAYVTLAVKHKPSGKKKPLKVHKDVCQKLLEEEIEVVDPELIVALGAVAWKMLTTHPSSDRARGCIMESRPEFGNRPVLATLSPGTFFHSGGEWPAFVADLSKAQSFLDGTLTEKGTELIIARSEYEALEIIAHLSQQDVVAYDLETTGDFVDGKIICFSFSDEPGWGYVIPMHSCGMVPVLEENKRVDAALRELFLESGVRWVDHFGAHDWKYLMRRWDIPGPVNRLACTGLMQHTVDENLRLGLGYLASLHTTMPPWKTKFEVEKKKLTGGRDCSYGDLPDALLQPYAGEDADGTLRLYRHYVPDLERQGLWNFFTDHVMPTADVFIQMENAGMPIVREAIQRQDVEMNLHLQRLNAQIQEAVGQEFNPRSPQQLARVLFEDIGLTPLKRTDSGEAWSTDDETLSALEGKHPVVALMQDYRTGETVRKMYLGDGPKGIQRNIASDGKVHSDLYLTGTRTGRAASARPNLMNLPKRGGIREVFEAPEGWKLLSADFSQAEVRYAAYAAGEQAMIDAFENDIDIHIKTAAQMYRIPVEEATDEQRDRAKVLNFGIFYGMGVSTLAKKIGCEESAAEGLLRDYCNGYPDLMAWLQLQVDTAIETGQVKNVFGRIRHLPPAFTNSARSHIEREAKNSPVQGGVADALWKALVRIARRLLAGGYRAHIVLTVHDEVLLLCPDEEIEEVSQIVKEEMERPLPVLNCVLPTDIEVHQRWQSEKD